MLHISHSFRFSKINFVFRGLFLKYVILCAACGTEYANPNVCILIENQHKYFVLDTLMPDLHAVGMFLNILHRDYVFVKQLNHYHNILRR